MYMIEISESKIEKLSEHVEQSLRHLGKAMQCIDEWSGGDGYGERQGSGRGGYTSRYGSRYEDMGERGSYGYRSGSMGYKDDEDDDDMMWGERRGRRRRDSRGRYM